MKRLSELGVSPAPWTAESGPFASMVYENAPTDKCASVCAIVGERRKADARLVAAAPDLYEALRKCMRQMCECCRLKAAHSSPGSVCDNGCAVLLAAKEAIEKAGGGE